MRLAARMSRFAASPTLAAKQAAADLRADGVSVIDLSVGEPDFDTPPHIVRAAQEALAAGDTHYTAAAGLPELRAALAEYVGGLGGTEVAPGDVVVTCGGKSALLYVALAVLQHGDEVVIPTPCWVSFPDQVRLAGAEPVLVPAGPENAFRPRAADLEAAMTDRTRLVIVNSPANPTGAMLPEDEWPAVIEACARRDALLLSDETYNELAFADAPPSTALRHAGDRREHVVVVSSFSKTWAMTGWRVGYAVGPPALVRALVQLQSQDTTHPATFAQRAAVKALTGPRDGVEQMRATYRRRRDLMLEELSTVDGFACAPPDGTFYLFPDVREAMERKGCVDDREFALRVLKEAHVSTVAGSAFHGPGCLRLSYAASSTDLREAMRRLREWVNGAG